MVPFFGRYLRCASVREDLSAEAIEILAIPSACAALPSAVSVSRSSATVPFGRVSAAPFFAPARAATTSPVSDTVRTVESADRSSVSESLPETAVSLELSAETAAVPFFTSTVAGTLVPSGAVMEDEPLSVGAGATAPPPAPPPPLLGLTAKAAVTATSFAGMVKV